MQHPLQAAGTPGQPGATTPTPSPADAGQPTLHEFITRLVDNAEARSAFDADPHTALTQAGFGDMTPADMLHVTSLVLDYAPVEVVEAYSLSLQSSVAKFAAAVQPVEIAGLHLTPSHEQEVAEHSMMEHSNPAPATPAPAIPAIPATPARPQTSVNVNEHDTNQLVDLHNVLDGDNILNNVLNGDNILDGNNINLLGGSSSSSVINDAHAGGRHAGGHGSTHVNVDEHDSNQLVDVHNVLGGDNILNNVLNGDNILDGNNVNVLGGGSLGPVAHVVDHTVDVTDGLVHDLGGGFPTPVGILADVESTVSGLSGSATLPVVGPTVSVVAGVVADTVSHIGPTVNVLPVDGNILSSVTNVVPDATHALPALPAADPSAGLHLPVVGDLPVVNDLPLVHGLPVVGDVTGALPAAPVVGAVVNHVTDITSNVTNIVHDAPVVNVVANVLPAPAHLPVLGDGSLPVVHDLPVVSDVTGALPLDHVL